jgi:hypothetical protein
VRVSVANGAEPGSHGRRRAERAGGLGRAAGIAVTTTLTRQQALRRIPAGQCEQLFPVLAGAWPGQQSAATLMVGADPVPVAA